MNIESDGAVKVAVVGGYGHHSVLRLRESGKIKVVAGIKEEDEDNLYDRIGDQLPVFQSVTEMVAECGKPDLITVGARYAKSAEFSMEALRLGVPVISEKPIAATWSQLETLKDFAARNATPLVPEFTMRWNPALIRMQEEIRAGRIGEVVFVSARKSYPFGKRPGFYKSRELYGGTIPWVAIHAIDFVRFTTGLELECLSARHGNLSQPEYLECEDHAVMLCTLSNGGTAMIQADFLRPMGQPQRSDDRLRVAGTKGILEWEEGVLKLLTANHEPAVLEVQKAEPDTVALGLLRAALENDSSSLSQEDAWASTAVALQARDLADAIVL